MPTLNTKVDGAVTSVARMAAAVVKIVDRLTRHWSCLSTNGAKASDCFRKLHEEGPPSATSLQGVCSIYVGASFDCSCPLFLVRWSGLSGGGAMAWRVVASLLSGTVALLHLLRRLLRLLVLLRSLLWIRLIWLVHCTSPAWTGGALRSLSRHRCLLVGEQGGEAGCPDFQPRMGAGGHLPVSTGRC